MRYRAYLVGITLIAFSWIACAGHITAQELVYTRAFTDALEAQGLDYYEPVETWLHVTKHREDHFMDYTVILENDINDYEVRYRLRGRASAAEAFPPKIEIVRLISSISVNDEEADIRIRIPEQDFAHEHFNAEAVAFGDFTPKRSFSEKPYGTYISLYSSRYGSVDVILLYYDGEMDPLASYRNLRFRE